MVAIFYNNIERGDQTLQREKRNTKKDRKRMYKKYKHKKSEKDVRNTKKNREIMNKRYKKVKRM